ncbi:hypothetical protein K438DRAFT_1599583 [Mycena galopus ATCC 62051]|nr:hypothetical protein K438DRAFT_1599583 [Mycena galopus ATCC 62051]
MGEKMGSEWKEAVELWWSLEESSGFTTSTKSHATTNRPKAVGAWVKNARKGVPHIGGVGQMETEWWAWWKAINPASRLREGELVREGGDLDALRCPGQKGFLNIIICLKWWYGVMDAPSDAWTRALADVKWVLGKLCAK